jgi:hypothetical protein
MLITDEVVTLGATKTVNIALTIEAQNIADISLLGTEFFTQHTQGPPPAPKRSRR